jgi:DNA repair protein RadC
MEAVLRDLDANDRPREKLEASGPEPLGTNELLAVVIGHGRPGADALTLANRLLDLAGGVHGLARLHRGQLLSLPGIGPAGASRIQAAIEIGRRTLLMPAGPRYRYQAPGELARALLPRFGAHPVERFGVVLFDTRHRLLATRLISIGSLDASLANPREVFREAMLRGAAAIVVFHNHPSGDPTPSRDDVALTARLRAAGVVLGIDVLDHLILADVHYCSMKDAGLL